MRLLSCVVLTFYLASIKASNGAEEQQIQPNEQLPTTPRKVKSIAGEYGKRMRKPKVPDFKVRSSELSFPTALPTTDVDLTVSASNIQPQLQTYQSNFQPEMMNQHAQHSPHNQHGQQNQHNYMHASPMRVRTFQRYQQAGSIRMQNVVQPEMNQNNQQTQNSPPRYQPSKQETGNSGASSGEVSKAYFIIDYGRREKSQQQQQNQPQQQQQNQQQHQQQYQHQQQQQHHQQQQPHQHQQHQPEHQNQQQQRQPEVAQFTGHQPHTTPQASFHSSQPSMMREQEVQIFSNGREPEVKFNQVRNQQEIVARQGQQYSSSPINSMAAFGHPRQQQQQQQPQPMMLEQHMSQEQQSPPQLTRPQNHQQQQYSPPDVFLNKLQSTQQQNQQHMTQSFHQQYPSTIHQHQEAHKQPHNQHDQQEQQQNLYPKPMPQEEQQRKQVSGAIPQEFYQEPQFTAKIQKNEQSTETQNMHNLGHKIVIQERVPYTPKPLKYYLDKATTSNNQQQSQEVYQNLPSSPASSAPKYDATNSVQTGRDSFMTLSFEDFNEPTTSTTTKLNDGSTQQQHAPAQAGDSRATYTRTYGSDSIKIYNDELELSRAAPTTLLENDQPKKKNVGESFSLDDLFYDSKPQQTTKSKNRAQKQKSRSASQYQSESSSPRESRVSMSGKNSPREYRELVNEESKSNEAPKDWAQSVRQIAAEFGFEVPEKYGLKSQKTSQESHIASESQQIQSTTESSQFYSTQSNQQDIHNNNNNQKTGSIIRSPFTASSELGLDQQELDKIWQQFNEIIAKRETEQQSSSNNVPSFTSPEKKVNNSKTKTKK